MRVFLVMILALSAGAQQDSCGSDACGLTCNDRGTCCLVDTSNTLTNPDGSPLDENVQNAVNGQYCKCNDGWTGVSCDNSFYYCDDGANACNNNGNCTKGTLPTGDTVYLCDCRNAVDDAGINYVGLYCEQAVPQVGVPDNPADGSVVCNDDGSEYCLNGGECGIPDDDQFRVSGCVCSVEYTGLHCEIYYDLSQNCTRECLNGGDCALGYRNKTQPECFLDPETADVNDYAQYQHCNCAHGFSGPYCETSLDPCGADGDAQVHCFNGGTCVAPTAENGFDTFVCDCSTANNLTHSFSGLYCQTPSTEFCPPSPSGEGSSFCVNNGTCIEVGFEIFGCKCPIDYLGDRCEFRPDAPLIPDEFLKCETHCENGGHCMEGGKDFGILDDFNGVDHMFNATYTPDFEHCICPEGFTGLLCEIVVDICPKGTHVCFHGGECVPFGDEWRCNCNTTEALAAGPLCQHLATSTCSESQGGAPFCVNYGTCQQGGSCLCQEGFRGYQCEIVEQKQNDDDQFPSVQQVLPEDYQSSSNLNVAVFTGIAAFIAISIIVVTVATTYMNQVAVDSGMLHAPPQSAFAGLTNDSDASDVQHQESFVSDVQGHNDTPEII